MLVWGPDVEGLNLKRELQLSPQSGCGERESGRELSGRELSRPATWYFSSLKSGGHSKRATSVEQQTPNGVDGGSVGVEEEDGDGD